VDDPHAESDVLAVMSPFQPAVSKRHLLTANPLQPEVCVLGTELLGPVECSIGESAHGQREERRVDRRMHPAEPRGRGGCPPQGPPDGSDTMAR
jgi:hypothetical protein